MVRHCEAQAQFPRISAPHSSVAVRSPHLTGVGRMSTCSSWWARARCCCPARAFSFAGQRNVPSCPSFTSLPGPMTVTRRMPGADWIPKHNTGKRYAYLIRTFPGAGAGLGASASCGLNGGGKGWMLDRHIMSDWVEHV